MRRLALAFLCIATAVGAETAFEPPIYHGVLQLPVTGHGARDTQTNLAQLRVQHWEFFVSPASNGIFPDREPVEVALGNQRFPIDPGAIESRRHGRLFVYRARRPLPTSGLRFFRLKERVPGVYAIAFRVLGVDVAALKDDVEVCVPAAVIVGDDDAFSGIKMKERGLSAKVFAVPLPCDPRGNWPWLGQATPAQR